MQDVTRAPPRVIPRYAFLQAVSLVVVLLLTQLHFQTMHLGFSSEARVVCDVTWFWLLATICVAMSNLYWSNRHAVSPREGWPCAMLIGGLVLTGTCYVVAPTAPRIGESETAPAWLWQLRLGLAIATFVFVATYVIRGARRCSDDEPGGEGVPMSGAPASHAQREELIEAVEVGRAVDGAHHVVSMRDR